MRVLHKELDCCVKEGFECPYFHTNWVINQVSCYLGYHKTKLPKEHTIDERKLISARELFKQCPLPLKNEVSE